MTAKEAIEILEGLAVPVHAEPAFDMAIEALSAQTITDDKEFMVHLIAEICDYAVRNDMEPDDTMKTICNNFLAMLEISTFNGWKGANE